MSNLSRLELRNAFGTYMTGVTVVTAIANVGTPVGFTANSFSSVSLEPPLLLVCPATSLSSYSTFETCENFAINILAADQQDLSNDFAHSGDDLFSKVRWHRDESGNPILDDVAASFSCKRHNGVLAGDHLILVGEVLSVHVSGKAGLGYANGSYFSLELERRAASLADSSAPVNIGAIIEHKDSVLMQETESGWRPITVTAIRRTGSLVSLQQFLRESGLTVDFGPVYSIFESSRNHEYSTYYRALAVNNAAAGLGEYIDVDRLSLLSYTTAAVADMMNRYVAERKSGVFNLYVGDEAQGSVHMFGEDS